MNVYKKVIGYGLAVLMLCSQAFPALAAGNDNNTSVHPSTISQVDLDSATHAPPQSQQGIELDNKIKPTASQAKPYPIPGGKGELVSNAWRQTNEVISGNTLQWDYQVSAVYSGSYAVETIRTTWQGSASLRNSASINLGISASEVSAGGGSSWQTVQTVTKYWENSNGAKSADYRSNMIVTPRTDYRNNSISIVNTARVKLKGDSKPYQISAGA